MSARNPTAVAYPLMACAALIWAGNMVLARAVHAEIPPIGLSFWRWTLALLIFLPFTWPLLRRQWPVLRREWRRLAMLGLLGGAAFHTCLYIAVNTTTAINAALLYATTPALVPLIARVVLGERLGARQIAGIVLSLVGVAIVVSRADLDVIARLQFTQGDLWMIVAVVTWSFYTVLVKQRPDDLHPNTMLTAMMAVTMVLVLPFYLWETLTVRSMPVTAPALATVAYVAVFASIVAYICYNRGIALVGPSRAASTAHMLPIFAAILSVVFLGETLHLYHLAGAAAVAAGIVLTGARPNGRGTSPSID